jgi:hypothetical protein
MSPTSETFNTNQIFPATSTVSTWLPTFTAGPAWPSFEPFRQKGNASLEAITVGSVATLRSKAGTFRIMHDKDFQGLLGLASEVHRLKIGLTFVVQAAKIFAKHHDQESVELLIQSVSMLSESRVLPERDGHGKFHITPQEIEQYGSEDDFELKASSIPRVSL